MSDWGEFFIEPGPPIGAAEAPLLMALVNGRKCDSAEAPRLVDAFKNEVLREAAEKIRQEVRTLKADGILEQDKDWAASDAADLIDPDKEA